jgi:hypothetical protein
MASKQGHLDIAQALLAANPSADSKTSDIVDLLVSCLRNI